MAVASASAVVIKQQNEDVNCNFTAEINAKETFEKSGSVIKKLSHKQWRRHLKKMRRKENRQDYARRKEREETEDERKKAENDYYKIQSKVEAKRKEEEEKEDQTRREKDHQEWLRREKEAIESLKQKKQEEEDKLKLKQETEQKIRSEWDAKERVEEEDNKTKNKKEEFFKKEMDNLEKQQSNGGEPRFSNPEMHHPPSKQHQNYANTNWIHSGTELFSQEHVTNPSNCKFYLKTGACRFGPRCSRNHLKFENSPTILIQNFFQDARLAIPMLNERNNDSGLEYDEVDLIHEFEKFYDDVIGEFRAAGNVVMFKCCQNYVPHLRGNVYVQFTNHEEAMEALRMFNGRYYAGRMLSVELSPVTNWKSSICGLFDKRLCPRGKACNFLHVFRNPGNAYSVPNRTDFDPERAFRSGGYDPSFVNPNHPVFKYYNQRDAYGYRSENASKSNAKGYSRNKWDNTRHEKSPRSRSRSRDRRKRRHSRSRSHSRGRSHSRSRSSYSHSRSRSRSHSRRHKRSRTRSRSRSRSKDRSKRSRSKDKSKRSRKHSHSSNSSRGSSKKNSNKNDSEISDTSTDWSDLSED